ncbi:ead/Ea22-like family protein [Enterobacter hormaechei]|uniref:ead/Ea22-like family protein n=1 Tax=Enterobacter hormaechei TaxID=158836 RepID=UPI001F4DBB9F|nr:ead/Ea22-like family protein [Enterobacter hormaechei]MCH9425261.1 ead/Ea22-like family protein [Enterobacter hormaechei]
MSNIDKQSLRTAAENATPGEWCTDDYHGVIADAGLNANYYIASCSGPDNRSNKRFIAAANPATVLALLDELEAAEKRIADLEAREVKLPNPHAHLIWIQAGHAPDDYWDDVAVSHSEKDKCCDGSDRYPVYALWEIKEALSAIGINVTAAGKGE